MANLQEYGIKDANVFHLFCLQPDLHPSEGCKEPPLRYCNESTLREWIQKRWVHVASQLSLETGRSRSESNTTRVDTTRVEELKTIHKYINNTKRYILEDPNFPERWRILLKRKTRTKLPNWSCCPKSNDAPMRGSPEREDDMGGSPEPRNASTTPHSDTPHALPPSDDASIFYELTGGSEPNSTSTHRDTTSALHHEEQAMSAGPSATGVGMRNSPKSDHPSTWAGMKECPKCHRPQANFHELAIHLMESCPPTNGERCILCGSRYHRHSITKHENIIHYHYSCGKIGLVSKHRGECGDPTTCQRREQVNPMEYILEHFGHPDSFDIAARSLPLAHRDRLLCLSKEELGEKFLEALKASAKSSRSIESGMGMCGISYFKNSTDHTTDEPVDNLNRETHSHVQHSQTSDKTASTTDGHGRPATAPSSDEQPDVRPSNDAGPVAVSDDWPPSTSSTDVFATKDTSLSANPRPSPPTNLGKRKRDDQAPNYEDLAERRRSSQEECTGDPGPHGNFGLYQNGDAMIPPLMASSTYSLSTYSPSSTADLTPSHHPQHTFRQAGAISDDVAFGFAHPEGLDHDSLLVPLAIPNNAQSDFHPFAATRADQQGVHSGIGNPKIAISSAFDSASQQGHFGFQSMTASNQPPKKRRRASSQVSPPDFVPKQSLEWIHYTPPDKLLNLTESEHNALWHVQTVASGAQVSCPTDTTSHLYSHPSISSSLDFANSTSGSGLVSGSSNPSQLHLPGGGGTVRELAAHQVLPAHQPPGAGHDPAFRHSGRAWHDVIFDLTKSSRSSEQTSPTNRHVPTALPPMIDSAMDPKIQFSYDYTQRAVIESMLRPGIIEGIRSSRRWKDETSRGDDVTSTIVTHYMVNGEGWVTVITLSSSHGRIIQQELKSVDAKYLFLDDCSRAFSDAIEASQRKKRDGTAVRVIFSHDCAEDCQLQVAMDAEKGHNLVLSLHKLNK